VPHLDDVFESFLNKAMSRVDSKLEPELATRFDVLELLDHLATTTGFRNILHEEELIRQLPLKADEARALLETIDHDLKLIRRESRQGGRFVEIMHERLIPPVRKLLNELRRQDIHRATLQPAYDMLYTLPDEPNITFDPLPPHFREALVQHLDRLDLDFLSTKILLRSLLISGHGRGEGARAHWKGAVWKLTNVLACAPRRLPVRGPLSLLYGAELDHAIADAVSAAGQARDRETARHLVLSALGDRSPNANTRIRQVFRNLIISESRA
jgi:hypothetical protein